MSTKRQREKRTSLRHGTADLMHCRTMELRPDTWDENSRSVEAVLATDAPIVSMDSRTGQGVLEVWRMDGAEFGDSVPLCDNHQRGTVRQVLGSVRDIQVKDGKLVGRLHVSEAEPNIATKIREGHIRDVSGGIQPVEADTVQRGQTRHVRGQQYTAPKDRDMKVLTRWRLREVSLTPIGADPSAKIRSQGVSEMKESVRKYLETIGLRSDATPEQAQEFYNELPEATRSLADNWAPAAPKAVPKVEPAKIDEPAVLNDTQRAEIVETERKRVKEINRLGNGLPEETVRKAIDEGWTVERSAVSFLEAHRDRTPPATPAIHSRSKDEDCTAEALGYGLALRSNDGEQMLNQGASYESNGRGEYRLRRAYDKDGHKKAMERLMNEGDRYRSLSMVDICREACRLDGKPQPIHVDAAEVFRTAVSGSALSVIFTTNINASFLSGYMDYTDTTVGWVSEAEKNNFLTNEVDTMGKFGSLQKVVKGRAAEHLNTSDWKESYKLARYGAQFVIDEQDIINDRFGALESESPRDMGLSAAQLRPNLVYAILLANGNLDVDDGALFNSTAITTAGGHANYAAAASGAGGPLAADSLQAAILAMAKQRIAGRVLNIRPRFLITPQDLWATAKILLTSAQRFVHTSDLGSLNPLADMGITHVLDDRVGVGGVTDPASGTAYAGTATNWFLAARPGEEGAKTIEVGYLRGTGRAPSIRSFVLDQGQWGIGWDIKMDIGAKALDFRGLYKAKGAA